MLAPDAPAVYPRLLSPRSSTPSSIACRTPSIGTDMIVGFPGETDEDFRDNLDYLPGCAAVARPRLSVLGSSGHRSHRDDGKGGRRGRFASAARACARLAPSCRRRFRESQAGTVRPGLTLEDGTLVVTDNYLKVRIPAGLQRNRRVTVMLGRDGRQWSAVSSAFHGYSERRDAE